MRYELEKLAKLGVVKAGIGLYQNEYHELDVYQHTLICVEKLKMLGARDTLITDDEGHILNQFKGGHEALGREMVLLLPEDFFADLGIDQKEVAEIVGCHYLPMKYFMTIRYVHGRKQLKAFYNKLEKALNNAPAKREDIVYIFIADCLAKGNIIEPHIPVLKLVYGFLGEKRDNFDELANLWDIYETHVKNNTAHLMPPEMFRLDPKQIRVLET
jgi:hypothetical protein